MYKNTVKNYVGFEYCPSACRRNIRVNGCAPGKSAGRYDILQAEYITKADISNRVILIFVYAIFHPTG